MRVRVATCAARAPEDPRVDALLARLAGIGESNVFFESLKRDHAEDGTHPVGRIHRRALGADDGRGIHSARLMKRGRENLEDVRLLYENASGRRDVGAVPSAKRWKRFVVRRVQSLLTNYFVAPKSLPAPRPFEPRADEDEDEAVDIEVDAPATPSHGESALTRYFSWSRRRPDHWPERPVRRSSLELRSASPLARVI